MSYKVVYFSRSGNSERIAKKIAKELSTEVIKISDDMNWNGLLGYIKAGYYSVKNKEVDIKINGKIDFSDEIILVSPIWAGGLASATKSFLKKFSPNKIHLVVTSKGSSIKEYAGVNSVTNIIEKNNDENEAIKGLISSLV